MVCTVSGDIFRAVAAAFIGLAFCMVGIAPVDGAYRYTFGITNLMNGIALTPAVIGMFATTEILLNAVKPIGKGKEERHSVERIRGFGFTIKEMIGQTKELLTFLHYRFIHRLSSRHGWITSESGCLWSCEKGPKHPEKFGYGIMDGIVAK